MAFAGFVEGMNMLARRRKIRREHKTAVVDAAPAVAVKQDKARTEGSAFSN
jgi:hypothetical protein